MKIYACIDLKSFYASVECVERRLDSLNTNLVVADSTRTAKTICLAISPSLKEYGLGGRARLFEVVQKVQEINRERRNKIKKNFRGKSVYSNELKNNPYLELDYIIAPPRMRTYIKYSTLVYSIYLKYISEEDIFVYSIDEVFCDITAYLKVNKMTPVEFITKIIQDVYETTGICATGGIGTNMYLAKVAMDIEAKHIKPNKYGVRIAFLDEMSYRKRLWGYRPLTDFWRIGRGISKKLEKNGMYTMGDIARFSLNNEQKLFKLFGVNAELIIDHAWGIEPCTLKDVKNYKPSTNSLSSGQVLKEAYNYNDAKIIVKEMMELLSLQMISKKYLTDNLVLTVGYDTSNIDKDGILDREIDIVKDYYGRLVPKPAHGTIKIDHYTSSTKLLIEKIEELYENIVNSNYTVRRINISVCGLVKEDEMIYKNKIIKQFNIFEDIDSKDKKIVEYLEEEEEEKNLQKAIVELKNKYGKNTVLKGMNLQDKATTIERNNQVGGHRG